MENLWVVYSLMKMAHSIEQTEGSKLLGLIMFVLNIFHKKSLPFTNKDYSILSSLFLLSIRLLVLPSAVDGNFRFVKRSIRLPIIPHLSYFVNFTSVCFPSAFLPFLSIFPTKENAAATFFFIFTLNFCVFLRKIT